MSNEMVKKNKKIVLLFTVVTIFIAVFSTIYEFFSFGVYSPYMVFAFLIPLIFGIVPFGSCIALKRKLPARSSVEMYSGAVMLLTAGCIVRGVLDVYGTTNRKLILYPIIFVVMVIVSFYLKYRDENKKMTE